MLDRARANYLDLQQQLRGISVNEALLQLEILKRGRNKKMLIRPRAGSAKAYQLLMLGQSMFGLDPGKYGRLDVVATVVVDGERGGVRVLVLRAGLREEHGFSLGLGRAAPHVHVEADVRKVREEVRRAGDEVLAGLEEDGTVVGVEAGP